MRRKSFEDMSCPIAHALEIVGEWWTPLILRNVVMGDMTRFDEIQTDLGIAPGVLTSRLKDLVEHGMLERRQYCDRPPRYEYLPTASAREFEPVLRELYRWGSHWGATRASTPVGGPSD